MKPTTERLLEALRATHTRASTVGVLEEVAAERVRQEELWGEQNHPDGTGPLLVLEWFPGDFTVGPIAALIESWAKRRCDAEHRQNTGTYEQILTEEWAEVIASDDPEKLRVELIQLAAVAAGWVEKIDRDLKADEPMASTEKEAAHHAVVLLPAIKDVAAPTVAELQEGVDLTSYLYPEDGV